MNKKNNNYKIIIKLNFLMIIFQKKWKQKYLSKNKIINYMNYNLINYLIWIKYKNILIIDVNLQW